MEKLNNNSRIFFEPTSHTYLMDGEVLLMGVTELLSKHNLNADYGGIKKEVLDNAAKEGTRLHEMIEDYDNGQAVLETPLIQQYKQICREHGLIFVTNEYLVSDEELVASKIDGVYRLANGHFVLVDYKFTQKIHWRPLAWQLGVYKVFFERQNPGAVVDATYVLHGDKKTQSLDGLYPVTPVSEAEVYALLDAERQGIIYIDENATKDISEVLEDGEVAQYIDTVSLLSEMKAKVKEAEETLKAIDKRILKYMEDNNLEELQAGNGVIKRKKGSVQERVDSDKLKTKFPHIWELVKKEVSVSGSITYKPNK